MWILWKLWLWKCEFVKKYEFINVNLVKNEFLKMWILWKFGNLEMWILPKMRIIIFEATPSVQNENEKVEHYLW